MKESRRTKAQKLLFHNIDRANEFMTAAFDIDLLSGIDSNREFLRRMFLRRHVYEHNGGVATAKYIRESADPDVEESTLIRETVENVHRFIGLLIRIAERMEADFHEIFPPEPFCIEIERERRKRLANG